ncbi:NAD(P)-dependent oxidoreductase [Acidobacteria bacterium AH-259-D05]|nr:NAD(P)-dependent oxidoreductase [Acidobacteria bacterium AH-259-D05]
MANLAGKTLFITGASRGIGKVIGLRAAQDGANIVVAAKTAEPHPKLPGTIYSAAQEMEDAGGKALPLEVDVRFENIVAEAIDKAASHFGGINILVNNASAIFLAGTIDTPMKRFDLMHQVNVRATYACSQAAIPHLKKADNPHILNISPPLSMEPKWFKSHLAWSMSKIGMSMCVLGMAAELEADGIAVNALWPRTFIATAAVRNLLGGEGVVQKSRKPEIVADAAHAILTRPGRSCTGNFFVDETILREEGITDFDNYAVTPGSELTPDFFLY